MRGGRNRGRGGSRGGMSRQNMPSESFVTEHLRDIDLELELLKRKREMLEQQHNILQPFNNQPQRNYNQPAYTYNDNVGQSSSNRDYSVMYDNGPQNRKSVTKKRPSDSNWDYDVSPKRSTGYDRGYSGPSSNQAQRSFNSPKPRRGPPSRPVQQRQSISQKISNQKQDPVKSYTLSKIKKPTKASTPPNKIASQPIAERNRLVAQTMQNVVKPEVNLEDFRLVPNKEPTRQMKGRMEMCLGAILSNVRETYADTPHEFTLGTLPLQRIIKQGIRNRIRTAMLGKIIGPPKEIIQRYRDMFPKETDRDIIDEAIKIAGLEVENTTVDASETKESDYVLRPHDYYKDNMIRIITNHLHEMMDMMENVYNPPSEENNVEKKTEDATEKKDEEVAKINDVSEDAVNTAIDTDKKDLVTATDKKDTAKGDEGVKKEKPKYELTPLTYKFMVPRVIRRYIPTLLNLLNMKKTYVEDEGVVTATTKAKYEEYGREKVKKLNLQHNPAADNTPVVTTGLETLKKTTPYPLPYYVKLMGKPQLPKRKVMQPFLEQFHTKSIKKHRTIHNLLFIGFTEKSDFDAMIAASGTVIGRSTISIRICENSNEKRENNSSDNVENNPGSNQDTSDQKSDEQKPPNEDITGEKLDAQLNTETSVQQTDENSAENIDDSNIENLDEENLRNDSANINSESITEAANETPKETDQLTADTECEPQEANSEANVSKIDNTTDVTGEEKDQDSEIVEATDKSAATRASTRLSTNVAASSSPRTTRRTGKLVQN